MELPEEVLITEVGPRDGFQMEPAWIPTERKIEIIDALSRSGVRRMEATSFVHPRAIPNLRDAEEVMARIQRAPGTSYCALVPNRRGAERAVAARVDEMVFVMSASEAHNRSNLNMSKADSLAALEEVVRVARDGGVKVAAGLAVAFGCPFEGDVPIATVAELLRTFAGIGIQEVSLGDTTGMANPLQVERTVKALRDRVPEVELDLHFHDTRGMGLANVLAGVQAGCTRIESSVGGIGGCPYAPGAGGNVCTEDVVYMLEEMGVRTGIDLDGVLAASRLLQETLGRPLESHLLRAGRRTQLCPAPTEQIKLA